MACSLLEAFCQQQDRQLLKDFYYQDDRRHALGLLAIREAYSAKVLAFMLYSDSVGFH